MRRIIAVILVVLCLAGSLCACGNTTPKTVETKPRDAIRTVYGTSGTGRSFYWDIVKADGTIDGYTVWTTEKTLGGALEKTKVAEFIEKKKGKITGMEILNYELPEDTEWAFYVNGELCEDSPREYEINSSDIYSFAQIKG